MEGSVEMTAASRACSCARLRLSRTSRLCPASPAPWVTPHRRGSPGMQSDAQPISGRATGGSHRTSARPAAQRAGVGRGGGRPWRYSAACGQASASGKALASGSVRKAGSTVPVSAAAPWSTPFRGRGGGFVALLRRAQRLRQPSGAGHESFRFRGHVGLAQMVDELNRRLALRLSHRGEDAGLRRAPEIIRDVRREAAGHVEADLPGDPVGGRHGAVELSVRQDHGIEAE